MGVTWTVATYVDVPEFSQHKFEAQEDLLIVFVDSSSIVILGERERERREGERKRDREGRRQGGRERGREERGREEGMQRVRE